MELATCTMTLNMGFLLLLLFCSAIAVTSDDVPSTCLDLECPSFQTVYQAQDFSIRLYNSSVWMSSAALQDTSFVTATQTGFLELFQYIQGANEEGVQVNMTAPVLTGIIPSDGPFCESSFVVRFYVPEAYEEDPPTADSDLDLHVDRWGARYFAVRKFAGFATDSNVVAEAASLEASLYDAGYTVESVSTDQEEYIIAQYNSPFEITGRVNEVWLPVSNSALFGSEAHTRHNI